MEEGIASTVADASVTATPAPIVSRPHSTSDVIGSPDHGLPETHALPSDEEPESEQDDSKVLTEHDLKKKIIKQVEYYFSDENLPTDKYMISLIKKNREGFVPIGLIASFRKMKKITRNLSCIVFALRESSFLVVSSDGRKVKRLHPFQLPEVKDAKFYTVLVENLPEDHSVENIQKIFGEIGNIKHIQICDPYASGDLKGSKAEKFLSGKLHALVEYETMDATEKAAATLNNEQDWRNGMRVKLIKNVGRYVQRKPNWRGPDSEKGTPGHSSDQAGEGVKHNTNERHENTSEEAGGDCLSKEKSESRGRNHVQPRKHKYRGMSGQGYGTTNITHAVELLKPPPGPRMPDGTRGFTMGRGRPSLPNQN